MLFDIGLRFGGLFKRKFGPELITDDTWGITESPPNSDVTISGAFPTGSIRFESDGALLSIQRTILEIGKDYRLMVNTTLYTGPDKLIMEGNGDDFVSESVGMETIDFTATTTVLKFKRALASGMDITMDSGISLKERL